MSESERYNQPFNFQEEITVQSGAVVSKTIVNRTAGTMTLFAFDQGQSLSEHTTPFDALVQVVEGIVTITIGGRPHQLQTGESILMPAGVPHAVMADSPMKMLLTMIKG
jgi:quercetin dioxygenase-like cupin family protein